MKHYPIDAKPDRSISSGEQDYLYFSGTNYLGIGSVKEFEDLVVNAIRKYGLNHGSSRSSNVQLEVYGKFEEYFAEQAEAEAGLLLSSGFLAGSIAVKTLKKSADIVIVSPDAHPAIQPNDEGFISSMTMEEWENHCITISHGYKGKHIAFISNAVDPLMLQEHKFGWVEKLSPKNRYTLLIDDSHAFGVLGKGIFGTYSQHATPEVAVITCGSLGKGLGMPGGIVLGPEYFIKKLQSEIKFRTASPPPPAFFEAFLEGQNYFGQQREKLLENIRYFRSLTQENPAIKSLEGYPVFTFENEAWVEILAQNSIIISSFPYPFSDDPAVNRIVLSGYHKKADLEKLAAILNNL
ncbi:pyridoxal phosphate-dependent aminotransferase family protein [Litoribacter alkaliphilus]|uniref:Pyridoxal phosphate-dependent aminotransferase family protein n=1 Tax=Litoribacter ruber TaxID=702568 RepID=A0AAP2CLK6_9BACT|nr:aminotransferase class I/II-fold pyridoxal phosphate-dependent enzyme [Litoribacter alkaliphilus]MBS9525491.1 pyridoxal phosphate-dependent aminotransferase family protein [Litoribacter alkaliphilus]